MNADEESFHFFHTVDGYEEIFSSEKLDELTPEGLEKLIASSPKSYALGTIGKKAMKSSAVWMKRGEALLQALFALPQ